MTHSPCFRLFWLRLQFIKITSDRRQSKTFNLILSTNVDEIVRNRVFDCCLSPDWLQRTIETLFQAICYPRSSIVKSVFDCCLSGVIQERILATIS